MHIQISEFFSKYGQVKLTPGIWQVVDSVRQLAVCFLPSVILEPIGFFKFPSKLRKWHSEIFEKDPAFRTSRRFLTHSSHATHHGMSSVQNGMLMAHHETHFPTLEFLSPLVIQIQKLIKAHCPEIWNTMVNELPDFPGIGGSVFQSVAINYECSVCLHRDASDDMPAWIYYFGEFENGELWIPELGIAIPVKPLDLVGLHGKYLFHGVLKHSGSRSSISFYSHWNKYNQPNFLKTHPTIRKLQNELCWKI
jgi:hypothetical protein